jgi:hypothetical protein
MEHVMKNIDKIVRDFSKHILIPDEEPVKKVQL